MPTIHYVQGQPFLIPDEVTELPTGTQAALPVTQDWYPSGYDNQQALPAQPDMWATIGTAGRKIADLTSPFAIFENIGKAVGANPSTDIPTINEKLSSLVPKNSKAALALKYLTSPERYQLWPEKMVRSGLTLANQARRGEVLTGPGLRREDFTDIPPSQEPQTWIGKKLGLPAVPEQPLDPLIERAQDVAGMQMGTTMFAKPGTASVGSGAFRKGNVEVKPYEYRGEHTAPTPEGGSPLYDVTTNAYPKDFYGPNGLRYYAPGNEGNMDAATYNKIVSMKNKPDELVKIYRAIPWEGKKPLSTLNGNNERSKINPGDWVTISKEYAKEHGEGALNGQYAITMKKVPAKELFTQGDSFHEWGWHPILLSESGKVGAPLSALEKAPMFYSNVENAVKASKQNAASKEQWLSYLKNQPGVKPEELEWTVGNLPEGKITKQQLEQHIAENKVQFNEVWKGNEGEQWQLAYKDGSGTFQKYNTKAEAEEAIKSIGAEDRLEVKPFIDKIPTKHQSYQLPGGPLSRDTEILTREGWKRIDVVSVNDEVMTRKDDGTLEWQIVQAVPTVYADKLYHFFNQSVDMQVTANHKMVVRKRRRSKGKEDIYRITAKELWNTSECVIPLTGYWNGQGTDKLFGLDAIDVAEFIGWYLAEGSYKKSLSGAKNTIQISQSRWSNSENCDRLESLFDRLGFSWNYYGECYGVGSKTIPKELLNLIHNQPASEGKFVPKFFFNQNKNVIAALLEALILGDGHTTKEDFNLYNNYIQSRRIFFSKSKQLADDVQILALLAGYRANVRKRPTGLYVVGLNLKEWCSVDDAKHNIVDYNDYAYCVTVENHCIYVRRNGVAAFTGNSNYRELLLTLPPKGKDIDLGNEAAALAKSLREQYGERWISQAPKEQVAKYENLIDQASAEDTGKHFKSSHWDEPNVLAHVRMNDREIPDVGKSLHIEEIQSDWHQAGRKQGYQLPEKEKLDLKTELENTTNKRIELQKKLKEQAIADPPIPVTKEQKDLLISLQEKEGELGDKYNKLINDGIPNAPFKKTWDELLLKRTINEAVRNGYDAISWTPGEAQAARYDLSKHVNELHYQNRTNTLTALDHNGRTVIDEVVPKEKVSDYIGKEVAEKLFKTEPDKTGQHLLEGEELIIGDKGMKAFYDKMMVDKANALAKKFGGKVETKDLNTNPKGWHIIPPDQNVYGGDTWLVKSKDYNSTGLKFWSKARAEVELEKLIAQEKKQPVHVLKLTPELKKAVSEKGFPLFTGGIPHVPPPEEPTFDERWRDRVPDEMMKRDEIKDLLEQQKIRNLPLDYTPPERKFEGRPVHLTKVNFTPEF